ncbi:hypothetical protein [Lacipirellula parvula]|uniref:Glycosyl hydrolase family 32 N-terminal domain-containing protein n=1 Tax=Lacipirellula parvula TaxID=2650471 RepID=A0A5K7XC67_9BACT|nr:hypothetical protein [Lacipirellula parvula]BBO33617.1 hypothetical protein PLANPX_3229 [Lacipirellula parvula]
MPLGFPFEIGSKLTGRWRYISLSRQIGGYCWGWLAAGLAFLVISQATRAEPIELGGRRELFTDDRLVEKQQNVDWRLCKPQDRGEVLAFDKPWEGAFAGYATVIPHDGKLSLYYRGLPVAGKDESDVEVTCYAESTDGVRWTKPELGLFEVDGSKRNNVLLAHAAPNSHNFSPFLDSNPAASKEARFKALAVAHGVDQRGLVAYISADGIHWEKLREAPVIVGGALDSQNVAFWSEAEGKYVAYYRVYVDDVRSAARVTSGDFINWSEPELMSYSDTNSTTPSDHLYITQTQPYFRAPHLYVSTVGRFVPNRRVVTDEQAQEIGVHPSYFGDVSDVMFMSSRGGAVYDRKFTDALIKPGIGLSNWVSRTNFPALNVVPSGPDEMSLYVQAGYGQPTHHLRRYAMRTDGFAAISASRKGGEVTTKPLTFDGSDLSLNFSTSAAGDVRVEIQDADGKPLPGYSLDDAVELVGNDIDGIYRWKGTASVKELAGQVVRLRFVLRDAELYSFQFR